MSEPKSSILLLLLLSLFFFSCNYYIHSHPERRGFLTFQALLF